MQACIAYYGVYDLTITAAKVHPFGVPGLAMAANSKTTFHRLYGDTTPPATPTPCSS